MVVRRRPSTTRITGAWNVLPAKPKPTRPTFSMTGIVPHALSGCPDAAGQAALGRRGWLAHGPGRHTGRSISQTRREGWLSDQRYELQPIGWVESPLVDRAAAPRQGNEGSPEAWLVFDARFSEGLRDMQVGDEVIVLTWLDRVLRDVLTVHPRGDPANPLQGVFTTRPPDRPNPIGLPRVRILPSHGTRMPVADLEALDRTPIVDVKPVLDRRVER